MGYFNYQCGPWVRYLGGSKEEVKDAIDFCFKNHSGIKSLGFPMPKDEEISFLDKIVLECWMPLCAKDQYIKMDILPDFSLDVNANVYHFLLNQVSKLDMKKEGPLYRMRKSPAEYLWVPESVKNGLQTYNWEFYREMVDACLEDRTKRLSDLSENIATDIIQRDGRLMKVFAVPHPEAGKKILN